MITTLLIVRHAQTNGNLDRVFQGRIDLPISEPGLVQLKLLSERFASIPIDAVCTSPLPRAYKTAEAITAYNPVPIETDDGLLEIFAGDFEGRPWDDLPILFPEAFANWRTDWSAFRAPNGESCAEVYARVAEAAQRIAKRHAGKTIAVVSHGCAIRNLLGWANALPLSQVTTLPIVQNTSISRIELDETGKPTLVSFDDASHLDGADLPNPVLFH